MAAKILSVSFELNNSTGNQDITIPALGGETVKAARIIACCATSQDATIDNLFMSMGFTDGTDQRCVSGQDDDNINPTQNGRCQVDDSLIQFFSSSSAAILCRASFVSFITNGIRINVDTAYPNKVRCILQLYAGDDISAKAGWFTPHATQDSSVNITTGFQPDLIYFMDGSGIDTGTSEYSYLDSKFGFAARNGGQGHVHPVANDNISPTANGTDIRSDRISKVSTGTVEITAFAATTFTATTRDGGISGTPSICYLALKFTYGNAKVIAIDSPTTTGSQAYTGAGFRPSQCEIVSCRETAYAAYAFDGVAFSHYIKDSNGDNSILAGSRDNVNPADTFVRQQASSLYLLDHEKSLLHQATFTSFDSDGVTLNFTTANGTTRKWLALFINEDTRGTPLNPLAWGRKCKLTIDHTKVYETVSGFPVCLTEENVPSEMLTLSGIYACKTDGSDIRISTDINGTTECPIEVVVCTLNATPLSGALEAYTKLPLISSGIDTDFYIWYNYPSAVGYETSGTYGRNNVWDSNYVYVSHCQQAALVDSTGKHANATAIGSLGIIASGIQQNGINVDARTKYASLSTVTDDLKLMESGLGLWEPTHGFAMEAWSLNNSGFDPDAIVTGSDKRHIMIGSSGTGNNQDYAFGWWETGGGGVCVGLEYVYGSSAFITVRNTVPGSWNANQMYYLALRVTKNDTGFRKATYVIRDQTGFRAESESASLTPPWSGVTHTPTFIGNHGTYLTWTDNGFIADEVRISKFERSVNWLKTTYETLATASGFITEGTPESPTTTVIPVKFMYYARMNNKGF